MSGEGAEARDAALAEMMGATHYRYTRSKSGAIGSRYGVRYRYVGVGVRELLGYGRAEGGQKTRGTREEKT